MSLERLIVRALSYTVRSVGSSHQSRTELARR